VASGERVLLDSVILIDHFNGIEEATRYIEGVASRASISAITRAEVLAGFEGPAVPAARALLQRFRLLVIDGAVADLAAELRRTQRWKLPDAVQAAVACHHGLVLATRNTRDFSPARHAFVRVPYTVAPRTTS
jgi:predicted nucleic acid-binding protein